MNCLVSPLTVSRQIAIGARVGGGGWWKTKDGRRQDACVIIRGFSASESPKNSRKAVRLQQKVLYDTQIAIVFFQKRNSAKHLLNRQRWLILFGKFSIRTVVRTHRWYCELRERSHQSNECTPSDKSRAEHFAGDTPLLRRNDSFVCHRRWINNKEIQW